MASHFTPGSATAGSGIRVWCWGEAASTHLAQTLKFLLAIAIHSNIFYIERVAELCGVSRQLPSPFSQLPNHQVWSPPTHPLPAPANWLRQKKPHKIGRNKKVRLVSRRSTSWRLQIHSGKLPLQHLLHPTFESPVCGWVTPTTIDIILAIYFQLVA